MEIRSYHPEDQKDLIQLWLDCNLVVPHNNPAKDIQRKLDENPEWLLIAEIESEIVGSCMLGYDGHRGWVYYLAVSPSFQRQGIASQLMEYAENELRSMGCPKINLMVRESNLRVIDFYRSINYQQDPVITMSKRLEVDKPYNSLN